MRCNQRNNQALLCPKADHHTGHQRGHHNVVGGGRKSHPKDQREQAHQNQHDDENTTRQLFHQTGKFSPDRCFGNCCDNDAGCSRRHTDADHVSGTGNQPVFQIDKSLRNLSTKVRSATEQCFQRLLCDDDEQHQRRRIERRFRRRLLLDHQKPDQHQYRQDIMQSRGIDFSNCRNNDDFIVGIVNFQIRAS